MRLKLNKVSILIPLLGMVILNYAQVTTASTATPSLPIRGK